MSSTSTLTEGLDTPTRVAGKAKRKRRKRTKKASLLSKIDSTARERQRAWTEGGRPNETQRLTTDLNGRAHARRPEGLFAKGREELAGEMGPGRPTTNGMYRG